MTDTTNYTWSIIPVRDGQMQIEEQTLLDVYTALHWRLIGTRTITQPDGPDGPVPPRQFMDEVYQEYRLPTPNPASFVSKDDVTPDLMVQWLTAGLGADAITALKAQVAAKIAKIVSPTSFIGTAVTAPA